MFWFAGETKSIIPYIDRFISEDLIEETDKYWVELFDLTKLHQNDWEIIEISYHGEDERLKTFRRHNLHSKRLPTLVNLILSHGTKFLNSQNHTSPVDLDTLENALLIFRVFAKYIMEHSSENNFFRHTFGGSSHEVGSVIDGFLNLLVSLIVIIPVNAETYGIHCAAITTLLILFGRQMHQEISNFLPQISAYIIWGKCASHSDKLVQRLILNFIANLPTPARLLRQTNQPGFVWRFASSLAGGVLNAVTLGYASRNRTPTSQSSDQSPIDQLSGDLAQLKTNSSSTTANKATTDNLSTSVKGACFDGSNQLLANLSSLLLLVLTTQAGSVIKGLALLDGMDQLKPKTPSLNPYRISLFSLYDPSQTADLNSANGQSAETNGGVVAMPVNNSPILQIQFKDLVKAASSNLNLDSSCLIIYLLLYRNSNFRSFILADRNYEALILPLLNILYRSAIDGSYLVHMALIILLIFTESDSFNTEIHKMKIDWVKWTNRHLSPITYGSFLILILVRTIRIHLNQLKDKYLHVNILAALGNLSSKVSCLHPFVCESLIGLLQLLGKRHCQSSAGSSSTAEQQIASNRHDKDEQANSINGEESASTDTTPLLSHDKKTDENLTHEITLILEVINSTLTNSLADNTNLVYCLLYNRQLMQSLKHYDPFQAVLQNIETILEYFSGQINKECGDDITSCEPLLEIISKSAVNIQRHCTIKKFPELKFKYVEEESPDEFFIPYVWSVVLRQSGIHFSAASLQLFAPSMSELDLNGEAQSEHQSA